MCQRLNFGVRWSIGRVHLPCPLACWIVGQALARKSGRSRHLTAGGYMSDPREGEEFFLNVPEKLDNPFPDLKYFREHWPVFYYSPLQTWFIFRYDDVSTLFHDARLSADRMKGFVDAAPTEVRDGLRTLAPSFERWVLVKDGPDHARLRQFLNLGFNATVVHSLRGLIQQSVEDLLDRAQDQGHIDASLSEKILGVWETISALPRVWECGEPTSRMERV